jgi:hypothetical protein
MTGMRRASLLGWSILVLGLWTGCEGDSSTVETGTAGTAGSGGNAGSLSLDPVGGGAGGEATAAGGGASEPMGVDECDFSELMDCGVTSVQASYSAANVLLVIDKSGSMDDQPEGFDLNKWDALKTALEPALEQVAEEMSFGLLLYPFDELEEIPLVDCENCCEVPDGAAAIRVGIGPGTETASQVMDALNEVGPGGGTPTAKALAAAYEYFTVGEGSSLEGQRYVLLATDGGPNCNPDNTCDADTCTSNLDGNCPSGNCCDGEGAACLDDAAVVEQIEALAAEGVPTFVIGIPGTEAYASYLDTFATAGTVPNPNGPSEYYAVSAEGGVEELTQTFIDITTHLVRSCEVEIETLPPDPMRVNVAVDCEFVPKDEGDGVGWSLQEAGSPDDPNLVLLSGDVCTQIENEGARRVDVIFGCKPVN